MDIVSLSPLRSAALEWQPRPGTYVLTVVCKATFELAPAQSVLAATQDPVLEADDHWDDDERRSLHFASEVAPTKRRAEVLLVGHAFAPGGQPVRSLATRLLVGSVDKSIEVHCDRHFTQDGSLQEGQRFRRMPLVYERAAGGPSSWNPVGVRHGARDGYGRMAVPNLQPPGMHVSAPGDFVEPIGFGPLAANWPSRRDKLGAHAASYAASGLLSAPLPEGFDYAFFNTAPPDQWLDALRDNERLVLENLHQEHARLSTSLPGVRPRVFVEGRAAGPQALEMRADTLLIDTDRGVCSLIYRGLLPLTGAKEAGRVLIAMEQGAQTLAYSDVERLAREGGAGNPLAAIKLPPHISMSTPISESLQTLVAPMDAPVRAPASLPFAQSGSPPPAEERRPQSPTGGLPFTSSPRGPSDIGASAPAPPIAPAAVLVAAPGAVPSAVSTTGTLPPDVSPPPLFIADAAARAVAPPGAMIGGAVASPWAAGPPRSDDPPLPAPSPALSPLPQDEPEGPGVKGMSDAAAGKSEWRAPRVDGGSAAPSPSPAVQAARPGARAADPRDALSLIWFDAQSVRRLRKHKPFREVLDKADSKKPDAELDEIPLGETPAELEDRRDIFEILTHASSTDAPGVTEALDRSIREDGKVVPPLVLCAGELVMPFDEVEELKATVATVTPFSSGDENLKASLQIAKDFLALPSLSSAPAVAEGLTKRIRDAFNQGKRAVPAGYVESQTERALLEQRHYQRRKVFGGKHLRGLLVALGGKDPIPTYLPDALSEELPMYAHFRVRLVAEVRLAEDQYESHPAALKVLAIGRVVERIKR